MTWVGTRVTCDGCGRQVVLTDRADWTAVGCFDWCPVCWDVLETDWHSVIRAPETGRVATR